MATLSTATAATNPMRRASCLLIVACWAFPADSRVPSRYQNVVLRITATDTVLMDGMLYEGNNIDMRGGLSKDGLFRLSGERVAQRWRDLAAGARGVFVLRDSLVSQQDHPYRHLPHAFMLPPNWITAAALAERIQPVKSFPVDDDQSWTAVRSPAQLFGTFPESKALFAIATKSLRGKARNEAAETRNARATLGALAAYTAELGRAAEAGGREAVLRVGAELIAQSDVRYFTEALRRDTIILICVENPAPDELKEGKGHFLEGRDIDKAITDQIRNAIYRRRLQDGDIAIERYDLSDEAEVRRAIEVLESLIPVESGPRSRGNLWLWVNGRLKPQVSGRDTEVYVGENATAHIDRFRSRLRTTRVDLSRLRLLSKPSIRIPKGDKGALDHEVNRFDGLGLPLSTFLSTTDLLQMLNPKDHR